MFSSRRTRRFTGGLLTSFRANSRLTSESLNPRIKSRKSASQVYVWIRIVNPISVVRFARARFLAKRVRRHAYTSARISRQFTREIKSKTGTKTCMRAHATRLANIMYLPTSRPLRFATDYSLGENGDAGTRFVIIATCYRATLSSENARAKQTRKVLRRAFQSREMRVLSQKRSSKFSSEMKNDVRLAPVNWILHHRKIHVYNFISCRNNWTKQKDTLDKLV